MTVPSRRRVAVQLFAPALVVAAVVPVMMAGPFSSSADSDTEPELAARNDSFAVYAGSERTLPVLANDAGGGWTIKSVDVGAAESDVVYAEPDGASGDKKVWIQTRPGYDVDLSFTYTACKGSTCNTATVRLDITPVTRLGVVPAGTGVGKVKVTNPNRFPVYFTWSGITSSTPDARKKIPARTSVRVPVSFGSVYWVGYRQDGDGAAPAGDATVTGIRTR